jgi:hypothetical protein
MACQLCSATSGQRQRLVQLLHETYHKHWSELLKEFEFEGVGSFDEFDRRGMFYLRPLLKKHKPRYPIESCAYT